MVARGPNAGDLGCGRAGVLFESLGSPSSQFCGHTDLPGTWMVASHPSRGQDALDLFRLDAWGWTGVLHWRVIPEAESSNPVFARCLARHGDAGLRMPLLCDLSVVAKPVYQVTAVCLALPRISSYFKCSTSWPTISIS